VEGGLGKPVNTIIIKIKNMKNLIIYYSFSGNTKLVAEAIHDEMGGDILELKPKKNIDSQGFMKYFWGGKQVLFKEEPELEHYTIKPDEYEAITIGTPIWMNSFTPVIRSFLKRETLHNKKIALFCTHEGSKGEVFAKMKEKLAGNTVVAEQEFAHVLKNKKETGVLAKEWAKEIIGKFSS
jgi:flavodoxin